jgi:hypothetical protein
MVTGIIEVTPVSLLLLQLPQNPKQKLAESSVSAVGTLSNPDEPNWVGFANSGVFKVKRIMIMSMERKIIGSKSVLFSSDSFL